MNMLQTYSRESIEAILQKDNAKVAEAILGLYARQTADEQRTHDTVHRNGRGFNFQDAPFMTSLAQALPRWRNRMTPKQLAAARRILPKYWRQIGEIFFGEDAQMLSQAPVQHVVAPKVELDMASVEGFGRFS